MSDDPNQAAICNAAIDRSNQDALTIARLCEEITLLRQRLQAKTQTVIDQDVLRRSIEKSLRDEIFERSREFQYAIKELNKQLEHERREREAAQRTIARLGGGESVGCDLSTANHIDGMETKIEDIRAALKTYDHSKRSYCEGRRLSDAIRGTLGIKGML